MDTRARQAAIAITQGKLPQYLKGIRSPSEMAAYKAEQEKADCICLSALLTTTMVGQKKFIEMLKEKNLFGQYKVMVGGAPVNQKWPDDIGADGYAENAMIAVQAVKNLMKA